MSMLPLQRSDTRLRFGFYLYVVSDDADSMKNSRMGGDWSYSRCYKLKRYLSASLGLASMQKRSWASIRLLKGALVFAGSCHSRRD